MLSCFYRSANPIESFKIKFSCNDKSFDWTTNNTDCNVITGLKDLYVINETQTSIAIEVTGAEPGRRTLIAHTNNNYTK